MMTPAEMREKISECKAKGISCVDLTESYDREKTRSEMSRKRAINIAKKIDEKLTSADFSDVMTSYKYYYMPGNDTKKERARLLGCFKKMMCFFETVTPNWAANHNKLEGKKTKNMSASIDENEYTIDKIVQDAEKMPDGLYGNTKPEQLRDIRISALTMFYANKIAHQCKVFREKYISDIINYEIQGNDTLDLSIKDDKFDEISKNIKNYYATIMKYDEEKKNGASQTTLNKLTSEIVEYKKQLADLGIPSNSSIYTKKVLANLVKTERDAYSIKDVVMGDLVTQLSKQNDILYGVTQDKDNKEVLVIDLPRYGQFSVHTADNACISAAKVPEYPYKVYDVDIGKALLTQATTPTMDYVLKKCKNKSEVMKELIDLDDVSEAHQIIVKLGYNKNALAQIYSNSNQNHKNNPQR